MSLIGHDLAGHHLVGRPLWTGLHHESAHRDHVGGLILVRHAMPDVVPDVPPAEWRLSADGLVQARRLAAALPFDAMLVSSAEPKARQTLESLGPVATDARFNEVARDEPFGGNFREVRAKYVGGTAYTSWEAQAAVSARFKAGVDEWIARAGARPLIIATHGMAMTTWLATVVTMADPVAFWRGLIFPDAFVITPPTLRRLSDD